MSRYTTVFTKMWQDEKFTSLDEDSKLLFVYLLSSPHSNLMGFYYLPQSYAATDMELSLERVSKGFQNLSDTHLIQYDNKNKVVLVLNHLKYNPIQNPNQAKCALGLMESMPKNQLVSGFYECVKVHCPQFLECFTTVAEPFRNGMPNQYSVTEFSSSIQNTESSSSEGVPASSETNEPLLTTPDITEQERYILKSLSGVVNYKFEFKKDLDFIRQLFIDFPSVAIQSEITKWTTNKLDKPLDKKSNPRSQLRNWCLKAIDFQKKRGEPPNARRTDEHHGQSHGSSKLSNFF